MAKCIVNCLHLSGKGKNMYKFGDTVTDDNFYEGQAEEYLKSGHLKEDKKEAEAKAKAATEAKEKATAEAKKKTEEEAKKKAEEAKAKADEENSSKGNTKK